MIVRPLFPFWNTFGFFPLKFPRNSFQLSYNSIAVLQAQILLPKRSLSLLMGGAALQRCKLGAHMNAGLQPMGVR
jgi:hypothetical protein